MERRSRRREASDRRAEALTPRTSLKPEIIDYNPKKLPEPPRVPRQPPFVRFMQRHGSLIVLLFAVAMVIVFTQLGRSGDEVFEVMQFETVSADNFDISRVQESAESYLMFALLMEFQYGDGTNEYEECAVACKIVGGVKNEEGITFYTAVSYEAGHFDAGSGAFVIEEKREYVPTTVELFLKDGQYSLNSMLVWPLTGNYIETELTLENTLPLMPERFAERIVGHPTASAELQTMVDRMLGRVW